jgi:hypothetical protein
MINLVCLAIEQQHASRTRFKARVAELYGRQGWSPVRTPSTPSKEAVGHAPQISGSTTQEPALSELNDKKPPESKPPERKTSPLHSSEPIPLAIAPRKKSWLSVFRDDPSRDLFKAIKAQNDEEFLKALKNGANLYETIKDDGAEFAAIHMVAKYGAVAMLDALLQRGVLPRMRPKDPPNGKMALHLAVIRNSRPMVERLIQAHAPLNAVDEQSRTPLGHAAYYGLVDIARLLLESGANVNGALRGTTPLFCATARYLGTSRGTRLQMMTLLIEFGAEVNAADAGGKTLLFHAVRLERFGEAKLLLAAGANINAFDNLHRTPLGRAIYKNQLSAFRFLTENGADLPSMESLNTQQRINLHCLLMAGQEATLLNAAENGQEPLEAAKEAQEETAKAPSSKVGSER